jgi:hypothetical protein
MQLLSRVPPVYSPTEESSSRPLNKPAAVVARRAKPDVAIQMLVVFIELLDCFAALAMTILAGLLSFSATC